MLRKLVELLDQYKTYNLREQIGIIAIPCLLIIILISLTNKTFDYIELARSSTNEEKNISQLAKQANQPVHTVSINNKITPPLFGASDNDSDNTAISSLYTLLGIKFSEKDPSHAIAFIQSNGEDSEIYTIGSTLPKGGKIEAINTQSVTILYHGQRSKLEVTWESIGNTSDATERLTTQPRLFNIQNTEDMPIEHIERLKQIKERLTPYPHMNRNANQSAQGRPNDG